MTAYSGFFALLIQRKEVFSKLRLVGYEVSLLSMYITAFTIMYIESYTKDNQNLSLPIPILFVTNMNLTGE